MERPGRRVCRLVDRRRGLRQPPVLAEDLDPPPLQSAITNEEQGLIGAAIAELPEPYQNVLRWHYYEQLSFSDLGARLAISCDAVRKLCVRAVSALHKLLDERGPK